MAIRAFQEPPVVIAAVEIQETEGGQSSYDRILILAIKPSRPIIHQIIEKSESRRGK